MPKIINYLEVRSLDELRPSRDVAGLALRRVSGASPLMHEAHTRVGGPHKWDSASRTAEEWRELTLARPLRQYWLITLENELVGVATIEPQRGGDVEIPSFGLLPEYIGNGLGGPALTLVLRQAWASDPVDSTTVRRVWLDTCSDDHPNALRSYQRRGMQVYRTEVEQTKDET
jgi:RimJ/RimL family protein N-acetyltransferase